MFLAAWTSKLLGSFTDTFLAAKLQSSSEPQPFYEANSDLKIAILVVYMERVPISWTLLKNHLPVTTETKETGQAVATCVLMYNHFPTGFVEIMLGFFL